MSNVTSAPWTVTYAPGQWLALAGPATLVVLPRSFATQAAELWSSVAAARSVDELAAALARHGVEVLEEFAAFFVADDRLHCLLRGELTVTVGDQARTGEPDARTWTELVLGAGAQVALQLDERPSSVRLPLMAGVALVSAVVVDQSAPLDLDELAQQSEPRRVAVDEPVDDDAANEAADSEPTVAERASGGPAADTEPTLMDPPVGSQADGDSAGTVLAPPTWVDPEAGQPATVIAPPQWQQTDERHAFDGQFNSGLFWPPRALPPNEQRAVATPDEPELLASIPSWVTHGTGPDDSPRTVYSTDIASTHKPLPAYGAAQQVLAARCTAGHANPPSSRTCRRCGAPVNQGTPALVDAPVLAQLVASTGQYADVTSTVLIGRAPTAAVADDHATLMPVPSVTKDISRTHLRIDVRDWELRVTDLDSTNGTLLISGADVVAQPRPLRPGESTPLHIGDSLDLGDGVIVFVGTPR